MKNRHKNEHLRLVLEALTDSPPHRGDYAVPTLWSDPAGVSGTPGIVRVSPQSYYSETIGRILGSDPVSPVRDAGGGWSNRAMVYNMLIRTTCAFDHNRNGSIDPPDNESGWRETGTFLKAIAILPYVRFLGMNTLHLLPVFDIGEDGRSGTLGSPYAVRDFFTMDPNLAEPALRLSADMQFRAFLEAAHHYGFRIILEIPLRTMSKDSVWIKNHPDWFYWIKEGSEFTSPVFTPERLGEIGRNVADGHFDRLPEPDEMYKKIFCPAPIPASITKAGKQFVGRTADGVSVIIPGAFADWPPDDTQPVWDDITYLKYYQDPAYNYVAYNTVRMYSSRLSDGGTETAPLWNELAAVVERYASVYSIDGIMIDMGHALPKKLEKQIISRGRAANPEFVFWAEDFEGHPAQRTAGYNAILGGQWGCQHNPREFSEMLRWISANPSLLPHMATPETHNTPRAVGRDGGRVFSRYAWILCNFIPAIPYLHSGFELYETHPINTGLGFTVEELAQYSAESLPLFSGGSFSWDPCENLTGLVRRVSQIRSSFETCLVPAFEKTRFTILEGGESQIIAFLRSGPDGSTVLLVAANSDMATGHRMRVSTAGASLGETDLLGGGKFDITGETIEGILDPGQVVVFVGKG